jgi:ribosome biogenesis protein Tsr3
MIINYHAKHERDGWRLVCSYPLDSEQWGRQDRVFIDEMLKHGHQVITCGWNMWEIAPDHLQQQEPQQTRKAAPAAPRPINYGQQPLNLD